MVFFMAAQPQFVHERNLSFPDCEALLEAAPAPQRSHEAPARLAAPAWRVVESHRGLMPVNRIVQDFNGRESRQCVPRWSSPSARTNSHKLLASTHTS